MNYKFYKYKFIKDEEIFSNLEHKMKESNYFKISEKKLREGLNFSIYKKNGKITFECDSYCIYICSDNISEEDFDFVINYEFNKYLSEDGANSFPFFDVYNVFVIVDSLRLTRVLLDFLHYAVVMPIANGKSWYGKAQIPIIYTSENNILYFGVYPSNSSIGKAGFSVQLFRRFNDYNKLLLSNAEGELIKTNNGKKYKNDTYPLKVHFHRYSNSINEEILNIVMISFILSLSIFLFIFDSINILMISFTSLLIFCILRFLFKNKINDRVKKYEKIIIDNMTSSSLKKDLIKLLLSKNYHMVNKYILKNRNKIFYFVDKNSDLKLDVTKKNFVILMDSNTKFDYKKCESFNDNVFIIQINDNYIFDILTPSNIRLKKYFLRIVEKYYRMKF